MSQHHLPMSSDKFYFSHERFFKMEKMICILGKYIIVPVQSVLVTIYEFSRDLSPLICSCCLCSLSARTRNDLTNCSLAACNSSSS